MIGSRSMTLAEAADELGVDPATLRRQISLGKLTAKKLGPIWTVTAAEVDRYRRDSHGRQGRPPSHGV